MEVVLREKTYKVKYSIRAMLAFEQLAGKSFEIKNLTDLYIFCYCMLLAGMNEEPLTFDEFLDACDEDQEMITRLSEYVNKQAKVNERFAGEEESKKRCRKHKHTRTL